MLSIMQEADLIVKEFITTMFFYPNIPSGKWFPYKIQWPPSY